MSFRLVILEHEAHADLRRAVQAAVPGCEVHVLTTPEHDPGLVAAADAVYGTLPPEAFASAVALRWIQAPLAGLGPDWFHPALVASDVVVTNMQGIYNEYLANHLMAFVLTFARRFDVFFRRQLEHRWESGAEMIAGNVEPPEFHDLASSTALVVGVGGAGTETGRLAKAFGMRVIGIDPRTRPDVPGFDEVHPPSRLDDLLPSADFVLITVPETPSTARMFDRARLTRMKRSAVICNVGRGSAIVTDDLVHALRAGQIGGAGLDVVTPEPLPADHPLWDLPGVLLTSHCAVAGSTTLPERRQAVLVENAKRFAAGHELINVVDKRVWF